MFYSVFRSILAVLVFLLNGRIRIEQKNNLPKDSTYILVAPHRSWLDPVFLAIATSPDAFAFMGKKEIFKNPIVRWVALKLNAFPIDRKNPGPSAIKIPVKALKEKNLSVMIFPSGSRYSSDMKGGALTIAKLSGKPIIPAVYSGPLTFKELLKRKKAVVRFGEPIVVDRKTRLDHETISRLGNKMQLSFEQIEQDIQSNRKKR